MSFEEWWTEHDSKSRAPIAVDSGHPWVEDARAAWDAAYEAGRRSRDPAPGYRHKTVCSFCDRQHGHDKECAACFARLGVAS